jgi:hypothetical protein
MAARESEIQSRIRSAINNDGRARLVRNSVGFATAEKLRFGLGIGSADLIGLLRGGRAFAIEVKRPGQALRPEQVSWWRAFRSWGGLGGVATSVTEAMALLEQAVAEGGAK